MNALARSYRRMARLQRWVMVPLMLLLAGMNTVIALGPEGWWLQWVIVALWLVAAGAWAVAGHHAARAADAMEEAEAALQRILERYHR